MDHIKPLYWPRFPDRFESRKDDNVQIGAPSTCLDGVQLSRRAALRVAQQTTVMRENNKSNTAKNIFPDKRTTESGSVRADSLMNYMKQHFEAL